MERNNNSEDVIVVDYKLTSDIGPDFDKCTNWSAYVNVG